MFIELFRQIKEHLFWLNEHPLQFFRICRSFFKYLFKGYSDMDLFDVDYYLLLKFNQIIGDFAKDNIGCPSNLTQKQWEKQLERAQYCAKKILEDRYTNTEEFLELEKLRQEWLYFIHEHFFDLWH